VEACTLVHLHANPKTALEQGPGSLSVRNTAMFGYSGISNGSPTRNNNASDGTVPFGSSNQNALNFAAQFENAANDFRTKTGAALLANGTSTGTPSTDILGQTRPVSRSIGAHDIPGGGGGGASVGRLINGGLINVGLVGRSRLVGWRGEY
jgi:hypothetical protein